MSGENLIGRTDEVHPSAADVRPMQDPYAWWRCPNSPPCAHGLLLHDREDYDDPSPTCCVDGCTCGRAGVSTGEPQ